MVQFFFKHPVLPETLLKLGSLLNLATVGSYFYVFLTSIVDGVLFAVIHIMKNEILSSKTDDIIDEISKVL